MTSWISKIFVSNAPRTWGSALRDNQIVFRSARKYFFDYLTTPTYERTLLRYGTELSRRRKIATKPYWDPILMEHVRKHIPEFDFRATYYTILQDRWNPMYGQLDFSAAAVITEVEGELYERDRLMQLFEQCPEGSYGYYAARGLRPVKLVVQSFAAAQIDQFFASCTELLVQPFGPRSDNIMSALETYYWNTRKDFIDYTAGQLLGQRGRSNAVWLAAKVSEFVEGQRHTKLPDGKELTEEQWNEITATLLKLAPQINIDALDGLVKSLSDTYDRMAEENRLAAKSAPTGPTTPLKLDE